MFSNPLYPLVIRYFFLFLMLVFISGIMIFIEHTQFTLEGITNYYAPKTLHGLLETLTPHLFGMGVMLFILTHFYAIIKGKLSSRAYMLSITLFIVMILSNITPIFISEALILFSILKLLSTLLLFLISLLMVFELW